MIAKRGCAGKAEPGGQAMGFGRFLVLVLALLLSALAVLPLFSVQIELPLYSMVVFSRGAAMPLFLATFLAYVIALGLVWISICFWFWGESAWPRRPSFP